MAVTDDMLGHVSSALEQGSHENYSHWIKIKSVLFYIDITASGS